MKQDDIAIKVQNVSKAFKLPHEKHTSIKGAFISRFRGGKRSFEHQRVLHDVSFDIKRGEFFGIVGRNGSGKSTLLKMIAGIYEPSSGTIQINGKLTPFIELGVGFNPELTGRENVFLNGALLGFNRKEMEAMYEDIVEFAELEKFMDQKLKNYSSGMQVRLAFSIAIRANSDILVLDEVLAVGDALFQKKCFEYFAQLKKQKKTVVFVSHDAESLRRFCDKGILIVSGKIKKQGDINKVVEAYQETLIKESDKQLNKQATTKQEKKQKKPAHIVSCSTLEGGKKTKTFKYKEPIEVEFVIERSLKKLNSMNMSIGIYNGPYEAHGDRVFGVSTLLEKISVPDGANRVKLTMDSPDLRNGTYLVYASLFGESEEVPYDFVAEIAQFSVQGAPDVMSRGVIMTDYNWSFS